MYTYIYIYIYIYTYIYTHIYIYRPEDQRSHRGRRPGCHRYREVLLLQQNNISFFGVHPPLWYPTPAPPPPVSYLYQRVRLNFVPWFNLVLFASTTVCCAGRPTTRYRAAREPLPRVSTALQGSKCVRRELTRRKYQVRVYPLLGGVHSARAAASRLVSWGVICFLFFSF